VGATLLAVAAGGLAHLAGGCPAFDDPVDDLRAAGGWFGVAIGTPLRGLLGPGGSIAVLALLAVVALVVLTRTPLRDAADRTVAGVRPHAGGLSRRLAALFRLPDEAPADGGADDLDDLAFVPDDDTLVVTSDDGPAAGPSAEVDGEP
jgi:S-DNA-T family DNA segregation ATPase FtsK/SpoIIIE